MPKWTTLPEASTACNELLHYGCKNLVKGYVNVLGQSCSVLFFVLVQDTAADKNNYNKI